MKFFLWIFTIYLTFLSCKNDSITVIDISHIDVNFSVERFDEAFYNASEESLFTLKKKFPVFFPTFVPDSVWLSKIYNNDEQLLFRETQKIYKNFLNQNQNLKLLFKHLKYYNSKFKSPKVITMLTNLDYENRVIYADSLLLISLDSYLGKNHKFYNDYPTYIKENNSKDHIIVDVAKEIINTQFKPTGKFNNRSFLAKIIFEGKKMYFLDLYLPFVSEKEKSGYSLDKLIWAKNNEEEVWKIFIEKEFLYSTDTNLNKRFIENAPFSKFYTSQDNESPGKIGVYIGWQIVKSYMNNNDVSLQKLIQIDSQSLFAKSRYKPIK